MSRTRPEANQKKDRVKPLSELLFFRNKNGEFLAKLPAGGAAGNRTPI
jgi:hypothetical protein